MVERSQCCLLRQAPQCIDDLRQSWCVNTVRLCNSKVLVANSIVVGMQDDAAEELPAYLHKYCNTSRCIAWHHVARPSWAHPLIEICAGEDTAPGQGFHLLCNCGI